MPLLTEPPSALAAEGIRKTLVNPWLGTHKTRQIGSTFNSWSLWLCLTGSLALFILSAESLWKIYTSLHLLLNFGPPAPFLLSVEHLTSCLTKKTVRHSFHFPSSYPQTYFLPTSILHDVRKPVSPCEFWILSSAFPGISVHLSRLFSLLFLESLLLYWVLLAPFLPPRRMHDYLRTGGWCVLWGEPNGHNLGGCLCTDEEAVETP